MANIIELCRRDNQICRLVEFRHQEIDGRILNPEALLLSTTDDSIVVISRFTVHDAAGKPIKAHLGFARMLPGASVLSTKLVSLHSTAVSTLCTNVEPCNYSGKFTFWKLGVSYHNSCVFDERTDGLTMPSMPDIETQLLDQVQPGQSLIWKEASYSCEDD